MEPIEATVIFLSPLRVREVNKLKKPSKNNMQGLRFAKAIIEWSNAESSLREWDIDEESLPKEMKTIYSNLGKTGTIRNEFSAITLAIGQQVKGQIRQGKFYIL